MTYSTREFTARRPHKLRLLACCAALALAGCAAPAQLTAPGQHPAGHGSPGSPAVSVSCASATLRVSAGRQGENTGAHGDIEFTNLSSRPCTLRGVPTVAIAAANGKLLPVRLVPWPHVYRKAVVLAPGVPDAADLVVFWTNWCGHSPGPLSVRVILPAGGGVITGPFNGPPDYNFVPGCMSTAQPSIVSVIAAYGPGLAA